MQTLGFSISGVLAFGGIPPTLPALIEAENYDTGGAGVSYVDNNPENVGEMVAQMSTLLDRVTHFQAKADEAVNGELALMNNCKARLNHLRVGGTAEESPAGSAIWRATRVNRMLVEHFLRSGFYNTAIKLAEASGIEDLTNIKLFLVAKDVEEALSKRDTSKCLSWCHDNKSKLRKLKSTLEFNIRMQEFVELVKANRRVDAVKHARKYLSSAGEIGQMAGVQTGMGLLAFPCTTNIKPYRELFSEDKWLDLIEQFRAENYRLFQLSNLSVFTVALTAGLSALKTQKCYTDRNFECPVCQEPLNDLALHLPFAHCSQSRLICHISGKAMNENNQPMMLPNGYVYGAESLRRMAQQNDGQVVCPRTKEIYTLSAVEKVFVM